MKMQNPNNWNAIKVVRVGNLAQVWLPPVNNPEGELIAELHVDYIPSLISSLKRFEQSEGRSVQNRTDDPTTEE